MRSDARTVLIATSYIRSAVPVSSVHKMNNGIISRFANARNRTTAMVRIIFRAAIVNVNCASGRVKS